MRYHSNFRVSTVGLSIIGVILASGCARGSHLSLDRRSVPEQPATVTLKTDASGNIDFGDLERQLRPFRKRPPHSAPRPCAGGGTSCTVGLDVEEIGLSWDIHPDIGIGGYTIRVIGQFTTQGSYPEARYGL